MQSGSCLLSRKVRAAGAMLLLSPPAALGTTVAAAAKVYISPATEACAMIVVDIDREHSESGVADGPPAPFPARLRACEAERRRALLASDQMHSVNLRQLMQGPL